MSKKPVRSRKTSKQPPEKQAVAEVQEVDSVQRIKGYEVVKWKLSKLKRAEYNPRRISAIQKEELRNSLTRFGYLQPLIVNVNPEREGVVVGGHQRLVIMREEGVTEADVVEVDLSFEQERELNLRLNRNHGEFDENLLKEFFDEAEMLRAGFLSSDLGFLKDIEDQAKAIASGTGVGGEPKYPLTPDVDESYDGVLIFCKSGIDMLWLRELLGLEKVQSRKSTATGETRVIDVARFREVVARIRKEGE